MASPPLCIVFMGTPAFAVPSLERLAASRHRIAGVVCQPDRPAGRGQRKQAPPVKEAALRLGLPVAQPERIRGEEFLSTLREWKPDLIAVAAYGRILPPAVLQLPRLGCINVHASLLPRYRGAAPIPWAILHGEPETGVTIMQMNEGLDEGDILLQRATPIGPEETAGELGARLAVLGAELLLEAVEGLAAGGLRGTPQDHAAATFAPMIRKEDARIDWSRSAVDLARAVRAFHPWPVAFTFLGGRRVRIHRARPVAADLSPAEPGEIVEAGDTVVVGTGKGGLQILELQFEGRRRIRAAEAVRGGLVRVGDRFARQ